VLDNPHPRPYRPSRLALATGVNGERGQRPSDVETAMGVRVREKPTGSKVYWVFICHKKQRRAKRIGARREAERIASEIRHQLAAGDLHLPQTGPTFKELAEEWLERYPLTRSVSVTTMENYRSFTRQHLIPFFGAMPVGEITYVKIEDFVAAKRGPSGSARLPGKPLRESTLSVGLTTLRLILDRAVRVHRVLAANPAAGAVRFKRPDDDALDPFAADELRAILTTARRLNAPFAAFLRVWAQTGMREGEVLALQYQDIDFGKGTAVIRRTWTRERLGPPKTRRTRVVSFLHPVTEDTAEWRPGLTADSRRVLGEIRGLPVRPLEPEAFVFGVERPWSPRWVRAEWRRVLQAAGVRYRAPEQLRHTFASTLLSRNAPAVYVQEQGGWKSAAVLFRVYARWMPQGQPAATPAQPANLGASGAC